MLFLEVLLDPTKIALHDSDKLGFILGESKWNDFVEWLKNKMNETSRLLHVIVLFAEFPGLEVVENVSPKEFGKLIDIQELVIGSNRRSMPMVCTSACLRLPLEVKLGKWLQAEACAQ